MRRRLDLAASLIATPPVLFLDEPTTGLDPRSRAQMWETIRRLVREGTTVLLTTQYLEEADQLADRIAVIDHGKVIADGTSDELKAQGRQVLSGHPGAPGRRRRGGRRCWAARLDTEPEVSAESGTVSAAVESGRPLPVIVRELEHGHIELAEFALRKASLDEVFLALTGQPASAPSADSERTPELNGSPR